jgi:hypothetical protein
MFYPLRAGFSEQPYIDARAVREAQVRLTTSPALAHASEALESFWLNNFHPFLRVTLLLSLVAWLATILFAVSSATNTWKAQFIAPFPEPGFFASLTVVSLLFLYNAVVTALFAEPDYRYQHFIVLLRILLAGFGTIVLARLFELRSTLDTSFIKNVRAGLKAIQSRDLLVRSLQYRVPRVFVLLFCITCALFAWWGYVMYASAGTPATHGLISP